MNLTICIPTYKRLEYLKEFVETVPEKYPICISDNGHFIKDNLFLRRNVNIKHIDKVVPMFENWNFAMKMANTEWIILPGDDDVVKADKLELIEEYLTKYKDCGLILFGHSIIDENNRETKGWCPLTEKKVEPPLAFTELDRHINCRWPSIVINLNKVKEIGFFDTDFAFCASDCLFLQKIALAYPIAYIPIVVGEYRIWNNSYTNEKILTIQWFEQLFLWQKKLKDILMGKGFQIDYSKMKDLVLFDNLYFAIKVSKGRMSFRNRLKLIKRIGVPYRAGILNLLRLCKILIF